MNTFKKIDKQNGIKVNGVALWPVGTGGHNLYKMGMDSLGELAFYCGNGKTGHAGSSSSFEYYLTSVQADIWNKYIDEQDLLEKAKALTPEGATFLGLLEDGEVEVGEGSWYGVLTVDELKHGTSEDETEIMWVDSDEWMDDGSYGRCCFYSISPKAMLEKAEAMTPDGATFLGRLTTLKGLGDGIELGVLTNYYILTQHIDFDWGTAKSWREFTDCGFYYYSRPVKKEETIEEALATIESLEVTLIEDHVESGKGVLADTAEGMAEHYKELLDKRLNGLATKEISKQLTRRLHDAWVEQLTGTKPVDPDGADYGAMCQVARALYGKKGGDQ